MKLTSLTAIKEEPLTHNPKIQKRVMVKKGEVAHLTQFAQTTFRPGQISSEHVHDDIYEIYLVESGSGIVKVNGKVTQIKEGDSIVVEPQEAHEFLNTGSEDLTLTYFGVEK